MRFFFLILSVVFDLLQQFLDIKFRKPYTRYIIIFNRQEIMIFFNILHTIQSIDILFIMVYCFLPNSIMFKHIINYLMRVKKRTESVVTSVTNHGLLALSLEYIQWKFDIV